MEVNKQLMKKIYKIIIIIHSLISTKDKKKEEI